MVTPSLPMTVAERRNARLRAAALATIPVWLVLLAAIPRLWEPDLVPFGALQAAYASEAMRRAPVSWREIYADLTVPALALFEPVLRHLPSPVVAWVILRGLADALGVGLLYLSVRPIVGTWPAAFAALLYATSPTAWTFARNPATWYGPQVESLGRVSEGAFGPMLAAAALLAAVKLAERPTLVRGALLGLTLGLLGRSMPLGLLVVPLGAVALASGRASWPVGGVTALALVVTAGPALFASPIDLFADHSREQAVTTPPLLRHPWIVLVWAGVIFAVLRSRLAGPGRLFVATWLVCGFLGAVWIGSQPGTNTIERPILGFSPGLTGLVSAALAVLVTALMTAPRSVIHVPARIVGAGLVVASVVASVVVMRYDQQAEWLGAPFVRGRPDPEIRSSDLRRFPGTLAAEPSLRESLAVVEAMRDVVDRTGAGEVALLDTHLASDLMSFRADAVDRDLRTRPLGPRMVLPVERETVYLISNSKAPSPGPWRAIESERPSSWEHVLTPSGADTGARLFTIRPRPLADWLASTQPVQNGGFADGSTLLGVRPIPAERIADGSVFPDPGPRRGTEATAYIALYWQLPISASSGPLGERFQAVLADGPTSATESVPLLPVEARRSGEIVIQAVRLAVPATPTAARTLQITLYDGQGSIVRTAAGDVMLDVPLASTPR